MVCNVSQLTAKQVRINYTSMLLFIEKCSINEYRLWGRLFSVRGSLADCCLIATQLNYETLQDCIDLRDKVLTIIG